MQWPLTSQSHGSVSQREQLVFFLLRIKLHDLEYINIYILKISETVLPLELPSQNFRSNWICKLKLNQTVDYATFVLVRFLHWKTGFLVLEQFCEPKIMHAGNRYAISQLHRRVAR
jgi:hypothetical protein